MSTNYQAVIAVGLPYEELGEKALEVLHERGDILSIPVYYDAGCEISVNGLRVTSTCSYSYTEIELDALQLAIDEAKKEFYNLTGQHGKVYLSTEGF